MPVTRQLARPLLSSTFIYGGIDALRNPDSKVKLAEPVALPIAQRVPGLPEDPRKLVQINAAVQVAAGTLLAIGKFPRLAALALIGSVIPTTYAGHRFWEAEDEATKAQQRIHFLKNLGLLGGLILAAVDTEGRPSVGWRARRNAQQAARAIGHGRETGASKAGHAGDRLAAGAGKVGELLVAGTGIAGDLLSTGTGKAGDLLSTGADRAGDALATGRGKAGDLVSSGAGWAGDRADDVRIAAAERR
jgi:uncharacterized membrane protein YphA (DoxX/SURF4 family)